MTKGTAEVGTAPKRPCAIYARYSSEKLQKDLSVEHQISLCRAFAEQNNWEVVAVYADRGMTSATLVHRAEANRMLRDVRDGKFQVVLAECFDRLSREPIDSYTIFNQCSYVDAEIHTVTEGLQTPVSIGLRGIMGDMFLRDLGNKVRRTHAGAARNGDYPGWLPYGYRRVKHDGAARIEIVPEQAKIIIRIFVEYVRGVSPRAIADGLNRDGIQSPQGKQWNHQSFASSKVGNGILTNTFYIGKPIWGKTLRVRNPDNRKQIKKIQTRPEWIVPLDLPHLRIVDQNLWEQAQAVRKKRAIQKFGPDGRRPARRSLTARSEHLLAGLLACGVCGSRMRIITRPGTGSGAPRAACAAAVKQSATCDHARSYDMDVLQGAVVPEIVTKLEQPKALLVRWLKGYQAEMKEAARSGENAKLGKRLREIEAAMDRLVTTQAIGGKVAELVNAQLAKLEAERAGLEERARLGASEPDNVIELPARAKDHFLASLRRLAEGLRGASFEAEIIAAFRIAVDTVTIYPTAKKHPYEWETHMRLGTFNGALELFPKVQSVAEIIKDRGGLSNFYNVKPVTPGLPIEKNVRTVSLGRSKAA